MWQEEEEEERSYKRGEVDNGYRYFYLEIVFIAPISKKDRTRAHSASEKKK